MYTGSACGSFHKVARIELAAVVQTEKSETAKAQGSYSVRKGDAVVVGEIHAAFPGV